MPKTPIPPGVFRRGLGVMARHICMHPTPFIIAVIGASVFSLALVGGTAALGWVTDELIVPSIDKGDVTLGAVFGAAAVILLLALLRATGVVVRRYFGAMTAYRVQATLRNQVTDTYLDVPLEYHLSSSTGELLAHADADVEAATEALLPLPLSTGVITLVIFSTVALALIDPIVMLVGVAVFPLLAILNRLYTARVEAPSAMVQQRIGEVSTVAHESFDGALVVKTLGREDAEILRMREASDRLRDSRIEVGRLRALFEPTMDAIPSLGMVALLLIGSWRLSLGVISTGDIVTAIALFGVLAFPMRVVGFFLEELPRSVVSYERVAGVLNEQLTDDSKSEVASTNTTESQSWTRSAHEPVGLRVNDLSYIFPTEVTPTLRGVTFSVKPSEVVALVGSTGSGKSTLCQLLVGLILPAKGQVEINGTPIQNMPIDELRARAAIVFQESFLFAESLKDNILMSSPATAEELDQAVKIAQASGFIESLPEGLETVMGERGVSLSGGQRQRVALARALVRRPGILVLDDATSAVDPVVEARILQGLRESLGTTTVIVANRVSTIELADQVVFLDGGQVIASGPHTQLMSNPRYERLVRAYEEQGIE